MYHLTSTDIARWLIELLATYARKLRKQISKFNRLTRIELSVPEFFAVCGKIHLEQYRIPPSYKSAMIAASLGAPVEVCDRIPILRRVDMFAKFSIRAGAPATRKSFLVGIPAIGCFAATSFLVPTAGSAQVDPRVAKSMETLKVLTAKLGAPKVEGKEPVGGKDAPGLNFRTTKISNNF